MTTPILDFEVVDELLSLADDAELLLDLIQMFQEDGPERVRGIEAALAEADLETVAEIAHSLKGSAGNLGIHPLETDCQELQAAGREADLARVTAAMPAFLDHFEAAMVALVGLAATHRPDPSA